jgi:hypothetical protein
MCEHLRYVGVIWCVSLVLHLLLIIFTSSKLCCISKSMMKSVCMFDKSHMTFNFKLEVSRDVFKTKNECQLTHAFSSKASPQCLMLGSTCHFNF